MTEPVTYFVAVSASTHNAERMNYLGKEAMESYHCQGVEEYSLDESQVFSILGDHSYCGGELPSEFVSKVEESVDEHKMGANKFYFNQRQQADSFLEFVTSLEIDGHIDILKNENWQDEWKKYYHPIEVSSNLAIVPIWDEDKYMAQATHSIYINPGMGFGTGGHETTRLCLEILDESFDKYVRPSGRRVLDFGCGSGILGIAAYKLGAETVVLYDIDRDALANADENLQLNLSRPIDSSKFHLFHASYRQAMPRQYNLVLANVLQDILVLERQFLISSLLPGGLLILSGLLRDQIDETQAIFESTGQVKAVLAKHLGQWGALGLVAI